LIKDGWATMADKGGFLIVAPEGLGAMPKLPTNFKTNPAQWNSGQLNARSPRAAIDDVAFIRQLLDDLKKKLPYDESRVFATGHSNGGGMTFRLAAELSDRFCAIGMVAGRMAVNNPKPTKPLPTLYIIGTNDPLMPLAGGEVKSPWGSWINRPVVEQLEKWAEAIGCEKEQKVLSEKDDLRKVEYNSKNNGPKLTVIYLKGHGHHWPGAIQTLPESMIGPIKSKLNATDTIWDFFQKHSQIVLPQKPELKSNNGGRPSLNWTTPAIKAERVQYQTFDSAAIKSKVSYHIYAPEAYEKEKDCRLPVLYWLHGTGEGLAGIKPLSEFFDDAIRKEKIPPMLVVFPNGLFNSMWCDSKDGKVPMETILIKELIPQIDKTFRTVAKRDGRILEGFSMGGYGAGRLGVIHTDLFGAVSILAGGPLDLEFQGPRAKGNPAERERILKDTFGNDLDYFKAQSPLMIVEKNAATITGKLKIRVAVGSRDFTADLNRAYSEHLNKLKIDHQLTVVPGVAHETMPLLKGLGEANWDFYRATFGKK
jgi:poly(3-hydroxybutyrate) depolymerase